ncbi:MAG: radical SAM protein [Nitrospinae bacterium]|nr:radical SAM protein [Nitrospinota bacterium]
MKYIPRLVFWETTKGCNLRCLHCRAIPEMMTSREDLSTEEGLGLIDQIVEFSNPILVLSGGEPLFRKDIFEIAEYGIKKGLRLSLATNGTMIDKDMAKKIRDIGFARVSISFDGAKAETHDRFRSIPGSFKAAIEGLKNLIELGISAQINTTIAKHNYKELPEILDLALELGVDALHTFLLVPVGCGVDIAEDQMVSADEYEKILHWFYDQSKLHSIDLKATCAPHYFRVRAERILAEKKAGLKPTPFIPHGTQLKAGHVDKVTTPPHPPPSPQPSPRGRGREGQGERGHGLSAMTKGCLAGTGVCFVSHKGEVFPCGYLPAKAGDIRKERFQDIWNNSLVFKNLRNPDLLQGKCGVCEFKHICEGCRARAYSATGNYLSEEPFCAYEPSVPTQSMGTSNVGQGFSLAEVESAHTEAEGVMPELSLSWSQDAKDAVMKIPFFVRKKAVKSIEDYARGRNIAMINIEVVQEVRGK